MRIKDSQSVTDDSIVFVEKEIKITVISICTTNRITAFGTSLAAQTYYLGNPELTVQLPFSALFSQSRCPLTFSYSVVNSLDITSFTNFNSVNGILTVFTSDLAFSGVYLVILRVEDSLSLTEVYFLEKTFELKVDSICTTNRITASGSDLAAQTLFLGNPELTVSPKLTISTTIHVEKCPLTYSYYIKRAGSNTWDLQSTNIDPFTAFDRLTG